MNYGLYLSASGALTNLYKMDVLSNNLANAETPGFKPVSASTRERDVARVEDDLPSLPSNAILERLGAGALLVPNRIGLGQGVPDTTNRNLDIALDGPGFLAVRDDNSGALDSPVRLTRDGRLAINAKGQLIQASSGLPMLDTSDSPITLPSGDPVSIDASGRISQGGRDVARLQVVSVPRADTLHPVGSGLYQASGTMLQDRKPADARVVQGAIERSGVDSVRTMLDLSATERAIGSNLRMISIYDQLMERTITLGRVA